MFLNTRSTYKIRIGTRGSKLALIQAQMVADSIAKATNNGYVIVPIKTTGDIVSDKPLVDIGGKALFLKEIEENLLAGNIDIAVHSLKDVPASLPDGLCIPAVTERIDSRDAFISYSYKDIASIYAYDISSRIPLIGTCSSRRKSFLQNYFLKQQSHRNTHPQVVDLRGNVNTRLQKLRDGEIDAIVLAVAGLHRLSLHNEITEIIPENIILPAIGQGVMAMECRADDHYIHDILQSINNINAYICISAERSFMLGVGGNCCTPIAAHASISFDNHVVLTLVAALAVPDGNVVFYTKKKHIYSMNTPFNDMCKSSVQSEFLHEVISAATAVGIAAAISIKQQVQNSSYINVLNQLCQWHV